MIRGVTVYNTQDLLVSESIQQYNVTLIEC